MLTGINVAYPRWYSQWTKHRDPKRQQIRLSSTEGRIVYVTSANQFQFSREHGPADISPQGHVEYKVDNVLHRTNGPAVICENGDKGYYINGTQLTTDEYFFRYNKL